MNRLIYMLKYVEYAAKVARSWVLNDRLFHAQRLYSATRRRPNVTEPLTLNEKICHRLIYDRNPLYTMLADKLAVRRYVMEKTSSLALVPLIGIYQRAKDIEIATLPDKFVLKCNHDSGSTIICHDKRHFNFPAALLKIDLARSKNMYYSTREWQYKNIKPLILCEEFIDVLALKNKNNTPEMLRIHCFDGCARFIEADFSDDSAADYINVYDRHWHLQPFQMEYPNAPLNIPQPRMFCEALAAAQALSKDIDYCRIDLMLLDTQIYFSEITLTPCRGKLKITPIEWDLKLGALWQQKTYAYDKRAG